LTKSKALRIGLLKRWLLFSYKKAEVLTSAKSLIGCVAVFGGKK